MANQPCPKHFFLCWEKSSGSNLFNTNCFCSYWRFCSIGTMFSYYKNMARLRFYRKLSWAQASNFWRVRVRGHCHAGNSFQISFSKKYICNKLHHKFSKKISIDYTMIWAYIPTLVTQIWRRCFYLQLIGSRISK